MHSIKLYRNVNVMLKVCQCFLQHLLQIKLVKIVHILNLHSYRSTAGDITTDKSFCTSFFSFLLRT